MQGPILILQSAELMTSYPAFRYIRWLNRFRLLRGITRLNAIATIFMVILTIIAAFLDGSLYFQGRDVGLLEHPTVYAFFLAQWLLPSFVLQAIESFGAIPRQINPPLSPEFLRTTFSEHAEWLRSSMLRNSNLSRFLYGLAVAAGLAALIWNTLQNQRPERLGFDFWDSSHFMFGFYFSRVYKFYLWVLFLPALFHAQLFVFLAISKLLLNAAKGSHLVLEPFHPDDCGGVRTLIDPAILPLLPSLLIASLLAICALGVHERLDATPIIGISTVSAVFLALYLIPAYSLRKAIIAEKERQLTQIAAKQNNVYFKILSIQEPSSDAVKNADQTIASLQNIAKRVRSLPHWPQIATAIRAASVASASPIFAWLASKAGNKLIAIIGG
jgi:hypothetical protein